MAEEGFIRDYTPVQERIAELRADLTHEREARERAERERDKARTAWVKSVERSDAALARAEKAEQQNAELEAACRWFGQESSALDPEDVDRGRLLLRAEKAEAEAEWIGAVNEALGEHRKRHPFVDDAVKQVVIDLAAALAEVERLKSQIHAISQEP